ncbi:MAG: hypothetical protein ACREXU_20820 [Gammaproteobacteria bacterium]
MKIDFNDVLVMAGLGLFGGGLWLWHPEISLIGSGFVMMVIAYLRATLD